MSGLGKIFGSIFGSKNTAPVETPPVIKPPTPTPVPAPTPTPPTSGHLEYSDPVPMGQKLKIYYGENPNEIQKGWGDLNVFDQDTRLFPEYRAQVTEQCAIASAQYPGAVNCMYLALGYSDSNSIHYAPGSYTKLLTLEQLEAFIDDALKIKGINGIFLDMAGEDYAYDDNNHLVVQDFRGRQLSAQKMVRSRGVVCMWNAWQPQTLPLGQFTSTDWVLMEDANEDKDNGYVRWDYWQKHRPKGSRAYACTAGSYDKASIEAALIKYGVSGVQYKTNEQYENEE